ncbi:MAG: rRNA maturation RNase YbeY [Clostridia bacterium]|nr:rRNA maturation RNase YbeY [Clostridia bacterium]
MLKIYFNNIKNICLRKNIKSLFVLALNEKAKEVDFLNKNFEVSVRYAGEEEIRAINKEYRNVDKKTDVLSFPLINFNSSEDIKEELKNQDLMLGDIVICKSFAKAQAKEYKHSLKRELCFLSLHGFLHLLGYDHIKKEDEAVMMALAEKILKEKNIKR